MCTISKSLLDKLLHIFQNAATGQYIMYPGVFVQKVSISFSSLFSKVECRVETTWGSVFPFYPFLFLFRFPPGLRFNEAKFCFTLPSPPPHRRPLYILSGARWRQNIFENETPTAGEVTFMGDDGRRKFPKF